MYDRDQAAIARWARRNPDNLARVGQFVILTARVPLHRVPADMDDLLRQTQDAESVLWGWKRQAWDAAWRDREEVYWHCEEIAYHATDWDDLSDDLVAYMATRPGFGLAKAGFFAQLAYGASGCLDTWNITRFGLNPRAFRADLFKTVAPATRRRYVRAYNDTIRRRGGTRKLWNDWCRYVAQTSRAYRDPDHVSALHCLALEPAGFVVPTECRVH